MLGQARADLRGLQPLRTGLQPRLDLASRECVPIGRVQPCFVVHSLTQVDKRPLLAAV
jgi:hypothetical protein